MFYSVPYEIPHAQLDDGRVVHSVVGRWRRRRSRVVPRERKGVDELRARAEPPSRDGGAHEVGGGAEERAVAARSVGPVGRAHEQPRRRRQAAQQLAERVHLESEFRDEGGQRRRPERGVVQPLTDERKVVARRVGRATSSAVCISGFQLKSMRSA